MDTTLQHHHWGHNKDTSRVEYSILRQLVFFLTNKRVHSRYNLNTLSGTSLVKVTRQANHPLAALGLRGPHFVTQVCSYTRYTCVLVGSPKYVQ